MTSTTVTGTTRRGTTCPSPIRTRDLAAPRDKTTPRPTLEPTAPAGAAPNAPSPPEIGQPTGQRVAFSTVPTPLGCLLVAATSAGIRAVAFGPSAAALEAALRRRSPTNTVRRDDAALAPSVDALLRHLDGRQPRLDLPIDVRGTPFEERVWAALREIPYGATRSYGAVARAIGEPSAAREVGGACAANPIALLLPCHRVVRRDGTPGGYRWGAWRKHALLTREARFALPAPPARGAVTPGAGGDQPPPSAGISA